MILLSEIAERLRNEIRSWPADRNLKVTIQIDPSLGEIRDGEEELFTELLMMPAGLLPGSVSRLDIRITGDDETVSVYFNFDSAAAGTMPLWKNIAEKTAVWKSVIHNDENGVTIKLNLPISPAYPPVDIRAMAVETGIHIDDARSIVKGFIFSARTYMDVLKEGTDKAGKEACFRAAHSLKGAGKTLRAPELAAAARALEQEIKENADSTDALGRLESIWDRIELWFEGTEDNEKIHPLR
jgi:HPt (histidine-containing phosphotransfer) domain-containing protein